VRPSRLASSGFTLLEIMVAVAILGATLVVLLSIVTNNVRSTNHAKMTTAATFLARNKMVDIEDQILDLGFTDNDISNKARDQASTESLDAKDPMSMLTGFMGGMMSGFIDPIRIGLQESVRKVTVRVLWDEHGRRDQSFEVVQYLTDPAKLDLALTGAAAGAGAGANGTGNTTNNPGGGLSGLSNLNKAISGMGK
jgi:prepilin-type N-terminal cleavage/methylation domain-containing protein